MISTLARRAARFFAPVICPAKSDRQLIIHGLVKRMFARQAELGPRRGVFVTKQLKMPE